MNKRPNPERIDDENPEWTDDEVKRAKPFSALPESLQAKLRGVRGPQKAPLKQPTTIRFDADVLAGLRATGPGWQTRVNKVLRDALAKGRLRP